MNNTDIPPDALQRYADKLFKVGPWQDDELIETKTELNKTKDKMDDIPLQCAPITHSIAPDSSS